MGRKAVDNPAIQYWQQNPEKHYKAYLDSDCWCCSDAPINETIPLQVERNTGAHHWMEFKEGEPGEFCCRYCYIIRKFRISPYPSGKTVDWHDRDPIYNHVPTLIDPITGQYRHQLNQRPRRRVGKIQGVIQS